MAASDVFAASEPPALTAQGGLRALQLCRNAFRNGRSEECYKTMSRPQASLGCLPSWSSSQVWSAFLSRHITEAFPSDCTLTIQFMQKFFLARTLKSETNSNTGPNSRETGSLTNISLPISFSHFVLLLQHLWRYSIVRYRVWWKGKTTMKPTGRSSTTTRLGQQTTNQVSYLH